MEEIIIGTVTIYEITEYTDHTLATASWYDKYQIQPGVYLAVLTADRHHVRVQYDARLIYRYRVNSLLGYSKVSPDSGERDEKATVTQHYYPYEFAGMTLPGNLHVPPFKGATVRLHAPYHAQEHRFTPDAPSAREIVSAYLADDNGRVMPRRY